MKPGFKTTEFWVSVVTVICATALRFADKIDSAAWAVVIASATAGYSLSRGITKNGE